MARATTDDALRRLARSDKKRLVKDWNATLAQERHKAEALEPELLDQHQSSDDDDSQTDVLSLSREPTDRLAQWLRREATVTPSYDCVAPLEHNGEDALEDSDALLLTSGQVKRAYRTRARQHEAHETKRAERMRSQREALLGFQLSASASSLASAARQQQQQLASCKRTGLEQALGGQRKRASKDDTPASAAIQQTVDRPQEQQVEGARVVTLTDLPARQLCVDTAMRNDVLAAIRRELIAGRDVLLVSTGAAATASDERLMMQQLCTQSLMFCVREQELVPVREGHSQHLLLRSRICSSLDNVQ